MSRAPAPSRVAVSILRGERSCRVTVPAPRRVTAGRDPTGSGIRMRTRSTARSSWAVPLPVGHARTCSSTSADRGGAQAPCARRRGPRLFRAQLDACRGRRHLIAASTIANADHGRSDALSETCAACRRHPPSLSRSRSEAHVGHRRSVVSKEVQFEWSTDGAVILQSRFFDTTR